MQAITELPNNPEVANSAELIIPFSNSLTKLYLTEMAAGLFPAELPPDLPPWIMIQMAKSPTETSIKFGAVNPIFQPIIRYIKFLPDATVINWGKFKEFDLPKSNEILVVQPFSFKNIKSTDIYQQTSQPAVIPLPPPDPFLFGLKDHPLNTQTLFHYARLMDRFWSANQLAAEPITDFYPQVQKAVRCLNQLAAKIQAVITDQTNTMSLSGESLYYLHYPFYLKASQKLIRPLAAFAETTDIILPEFSL